MNNKGFAITSIVYGLMILLSEQLAEQPFSLKSILMNWL